MSVPVSAILDRKGHDVVTISPTARVAEAAASMEQQGVGALVVSTDDGTVEGIVSERDLVRGLATSGAGILDQQVGSVMTSPVRTCDLRTGTTELAAMMTEGRIRHLPVVDAGRLVGIVSIGDVVKSRIDELATQAESLEAYVSGTTY